MLRTSVTVLTVGYTNMFYNLCILLPLGHPLPLLPRRLSQITFT